MLMARPGAAESSRSSLGDVDGFLISSALAFLKRNLANISFYLYNILKGLP